MNTCLETDNEWKKVELLIRNIRLEVDEIHFKNKKIDDDDKRCLIRIYHNDYDYLKNNYQTYIDHEGMIFMIFAICTVSGNDIEIIKFIIDKYNIHFNKKYSLWRNVILIAYGYNQNLEIIKYLLCGIGMDNKYRCEKGYNCFINACKKNPNVEIIKYMVETLNVKILNTYDKKNRHALLHAAKYNKNTEIIKYLLEHGHEKILHNINKNNIKKLANTLDTDSIKLFIPLIKCYNFIWYFIENIVKESDLTYEEVIDIVKTIYDENPFLLDDNIYTEFGLRDPYEEKFDIFVKHVDKLTHYVPIPWKSVNIPEKEKIYNCMIEYDFSEQVELFVHQGIKYYSNKKVRDQILLFREISNDCVIENVEFTIPMKKYLVNLYILSCYTSEDIVDKIEPEDILQFLQFIDAYETVRLSPRLLEHRLIRYFRKYSIEQNPYIKSMIKRHTMNSMYMYYYTKDMRNCFNQNDTSNVSFDDYNENEVISSCDNESSIQYDSDD